VDIVIHHIGFDERGEAPGLSPLDELLDIVDHAGVPVQAVGGLSIEQAVSCPDFGAPMVVIGAPLAIAADSFSANNEQLYASLHDICSRVHGRDIRPAGGARPTVAGR
jgi:3-hexulose-6-phosphate synthase